MAARINKEFGEISNDPMEGVEVNPQNDENTVWEVTIDGPAGSPYEGGRFVVTIDFSDDYPLKAPQVVFQTKIYHMNVRQDTGEICQAAIESNWDAKHNARFVIQTLISLLEAPLEDDPLENDIAEQYQNDYEGFLEAAQQCTN